MGPLLLVVGERVGLLLLVMDDDEDLRGLLCSCPLFSSMRVERRLRCVVVDGGGNGGREGGDMGSFLGESFGLVIGLVIDVLGLLRSRLLLLPFSSVITGRECSHGMRVWMLLLLFRRVILGSNSSDVHVPMEEEVEGLSEASGVVVDLSFFVPFVVELLTLLMLDDFDDLTLFSTFS